MNRIITLDEFIIRRQNDFEYATGELTALLRDIGVAAKIVNREVNKAGLVNILGMDGSQNSSGDIVQKMDIYANEETQDMIRNDFAYIFQNKTYPGIPQVQMHLIDKNNAFTIGDITFQPIEVMHYKMKVLGFRINKLLHKRW